jgi:hypothetical protein
MLRHGVRSSDTTVSDHERADSWASIARTISVAAMCAGRVRSTARVIRRLPSRDRISDGCPRAGPRRSRPTALPDVVSR